MQAAAWPISWKIEVIKKKLKIINGLLKDPACKYTNINWWYIKNIKRKKIVYPIKNAVLKKKRNLIAIKLTFF